jgi:hypothetical protein
VNVVHVAADRQHDALARAACVLDEPPEHGIAMVAAVCTPVAAERGEWLFAQAGRPVVPDEQQPLRLRLID